MMNPWKQTLLGILRDILRFALWLALVFNGLMLAIFSLVFVYHFLHRLWGFCARVLFSEPW